MERQKHNDSPVGSDWEWNFYPPEKLGSYSTTREADGIGFHFDVEDQRYSFILQIPQAEIFVKMIQDCVGQPTAI